MRFEIIPVGLMSIAIFGLFILNLELMKENRELKSEMEKHNFVANSMIELETLTWCEMLETHSKLDD